jgi:hypothetical protein
VIPAGRKIKRPRPRHSFWSGVRKGHPDECWPWTRGTTSRGYGIATYQGRQQNTHRIAWMLTHGPIPPGMQLDHQCHTPACTADTDCPHRRCCNPGHLKVVTLAENLAADRTYRPPTRRLRATHCPQGHEYTPENTRIASHGGRNCRECERNRRRK